MTVSPTFPDTLDIHVTDSDIHGGDSEPHSWFQHPLALAASRAVPEGHFAFYLDERIEVLSEARALRASYRLPREALQFVREYYHERPVEPATFTLTLVRTW